MNIFLKNISLVVLLATFSVSASALVWGEGNWGESNWGIDEVRESVAPPEGPVPPASKVRGVSSTDAGFAAGAYSASGEPAYGTSFVDGDFITIIAEINPDTFDIGTNGQLIVVLLSLIDGKQQWSFLNTDGNFESWNLKLGTLGAAEIVEPLEASHSIKIFEGNLQVGAHRMAVGYMADGGALIYAPKAIKIVVSD